MNGKGRITFSWGSFHLVAATAATLCLPACVSNAPLTEHFIIILSAQRQLHS
jgi:hypothetical protein